MAKAGPSSVVVYEGPSRIDGKPIVVVATGFKNKSDNPKTGVMVQTWIIRRDMHPGKALRTGDDKSVCGGCKHRPIRGGACYVNVWQAPAAVWRTYRRRKYPKVTLGVLSEMCSGRNVRLGSYGDPAAVPLEVWDAMVAQAASHTGYSHQWKAGKFAGVMKYCQASVDTPEEYAAARARGFGTFRVKAAGDTAVLPGEFNCPASAEMGKTSTCAACKACAGLTRTQPAMVTIQAHGSRAKRFAA